MTTLTPISAKIPALENRLEHELMLCCSRTCMDSETIERLRILLQQNIDWEYLIETATQHGVMPLLYWNLSKIDPKTVPNAILAKLRKRFEANAGSNLFLTGELLKLLELFANHDIPAIPFKGSVLSASAYGNLAFRQFSDLDILVHKKDIKRAKELLTSHQYQLTIELFWENQFISEGGRVNIDLHRAITPKFFSFSLDFDELWKRLQPVSLVDRTVFSLSSEDSLLILCVYLARDCWQKQERLIQICDIAELLRNQKIDWELLIERATKVGSKRMLLMGLLLANQLFGTELPEVILQRIQTEPTVKSLADQVCKWLFLEADTPSLGLERKLFYVKIRERLRDIIPHLPYFLNYWITPSQTDRDFFSLPNSLSFLYYLVRQIRLFGRYGLRILS